MTNEELTIVLKNFCEKANAAGNLSFADALDLITRSQHECNRVEDCVSWFCEVRKELVETKSGKERKLKKFPHAKIVADKIYNSQIVKAYADAYVVALSAKDTDSSEDYAEVHNAVADALVSYFDALYLDYLAERYGDDFIAAYTEYQDAKQNDEDRAAAAKELQSAKQSLARLKKGNDAEKIAEAEKRVDEAKVRVAQLNA